MPIKVVLFFMLFVLSLPMNAEALKVKPRPHPCKDVPLEDDIRKSDMVAAVNFIDFTDEAKQYGRFRVLYAWKGEVKPEDEVIYPTKDGFSYSAPEFRHKSYLVLMGKHKKDQTYDYASCWKWYGWHSFSLLNKRVQEFNNAVMRSFSDGDSEK